MQLIEVVFFLSEEIFVQLDDLDELDRITHLFIGSLPKLVIWIQSLVKSLNILQFLIC